jgi:tetratricopeptide (TPR) repeat protein
LILCIVLVSGRAGAQSPSANDQEAKAHFDAARKLFDQARYADALTEFEASYRLAAYPAILYRVAVCQDLLGRRADARESYRKYLADDPKTDRRAQVEARIATLAEGENEILNLAHAHDLAGDFVKARDYYRRYLAEGPRDDAPAIERRIDELKAKIALLSVRCNLDAASVEIDRQPVGLTPLRGVALNAGGHVVELAKPGYERARSELVLEGGAERTLTLALKQAVARKPPIYKRWWLWTTVAAVVVAGAVAGGVLGARGSGEPERSSVLPPVR